MSDCDGAAPISGSAPRSDKNENHTITIRAESSAGQAVQHLVLALTGGR